MSVQHFVSFTTPAKGYEPIVQELIVMINTENWINSFNKAITKAHYSNAEETANIKSLTDY
jgi:hypothetical protein